MIILKKILENPIIIIIYSCLLVLFHVRPAVLLMNYGVLSYDSIIFQLTIALSAFIILFVFPLWIIKFIYRKKASDFGLRFPSNLSESVKITLFIFVIFLPIMVVLSKQSSFQDYYSMNNNVIYFIILSIISGIYYFAEEFLFRGLLFFGLWDKFKFHSFWIVNVIFAIFHVGKPPLEIILAFFLGLSLTFLSYKSKSFIPAAIIHFIIALTLNIIVTFISPPQIVGTLHF